MFSGYLKTKDHTSLELLLCPGESCLKGRPSSFGAEPEFEVTLMRVFRFVLGGSGGLLKLPEV